MFNSPFTKIDTIALHQSPFTLKVNITLLKYFQKTSIIVFIFPNHQIVYIKPFNSSFQDFFQSLNLKQLLMDLSFM